MAASAPVPLDSVYFFASVLSQICRTLSLGKAATPDGVALGRFSSAKVYSAAETSISPSPPAYLAHQSPIQPGRTEQRL